MRYLAVADSDDTFFRANHPIWFVALLLFFAIVAAQAQTPTSPIPAPTPTKRDAAALATLAQSMVAMGIPSGSVPVATAQTAGTVAPAPGSDYPSGTFTWTVKVTPAGYEFINQVQSNGSVSTFASGHGSPKMSLDGQVRPFFAHMKFASPPVQLPFVIFARALATPNYSVTSAPMLQIGSVSAIHIHISNDADGLTQSLTAEDWYLDPSTGLPLRVACRVPDPFNALNSFPGTKDFGNYQQVSGVLIPTTIISSFNGQPESIATVTSTQLNLPVTDSVFDLVQAGN